MRERESTKKEQPERNRKEGEINIYNIDISK